MRVLILYTELAGYVVGNINRFLSANTHAKVLLVHYPVNPEAPFQIRTSEAVNSIEYRIDKQNDIESRVLAFSPHVVLCSGWSNSFYMALLKKLDARVKKVVCFDNRWKASLKQRLLVGLSRFFILNRFQFAWVPGSMQKTYALKLGFHPDRVFTGLYPADSEVFSAIGKKKLELSGPYPKLILSVARYIPQKDLPTLWKAFISANEKTGNQWDLNCIGLGDLYEERMQHPRIHHLGFKQPHEMEAYILAAGVFVLPSTDEPWGVAVHEMALSALPLILSDQVGAADMFLNTQNGFTFPAGDVVALERILITVMQMDESQLHNMAGKSYELGNQLLSENWTHTIMQIYNA